MRLHAIEKHGRRGKEAQKVATDPQLADEAIAYFQGAAMLMEKHGRRSSDS